MLVGLGKKDIFTLEKLRRAAPCRQTRQGPQTAQCGFLTAGFPRYSVREAAGTVAEGAKLGLYRFDRHKSAADDHDLETFWLVAEEGELEEATEGAELGAKVAEGTVLARDLANEPSNVATPKYLAERARTISEKYGMELAVLDRASIEEEGLTGLATVGRSASNEPYFIALEHRGEVTQRPLCS